MGPSRCKFCASFSVVVRKGHIFLCSQEPSLEHNHTGLLFTSEKQKKVGLKKILYTFATCMLHVLTISDRMTAQNSKNKLKNFRWTFFWLHCSDWNSLLADLRTSPSLQTFKAKLKMHLFRQAFWLICTCQPLPAPYPFVCVCVCVCVCVFVC